MDADFSSKLYDGFDFTKARGRKIYVGMRPDYLHAMKHVDHKCSQEFVEYIENSEEVEKIVSDKTS